MQVEEMMNKLGIVIVNYNSQNVILGCLKSLRDAGDFLSHTLIVDNRSQDISSDVIKKAYPQIKILKLNRNFGFGTANNYGIKYHLEKGAEYIFLLNPDTSVGKNSIKILLKGIDKHKRYGICGPKIYSKDKIIWSCGGLLDKKRYSGGLIGLGEIDGGQYEDIRKVDFVSGTAMLIKREVFEKIGFFSGEYFLYYEDVDLCFRARIAGYEAIYLPSADINHLGSATIVRNSPMHQYYMARNHLLFIEKYAPRKTFLREILRMPKTVYEHYYKKEKYAILGINDYLLRRFGKSGYWN